ncbi:hypothetical protein CVV26_02725 [Candidatus Kuenenbacteria bacterium HGW-Kuenenbacteria-1]|uniref:Fibrobacter succinogenes major paralogous domain-containing protein n=1 Tax=Candidatus Kuenenbacteria bacterium HGW-Kuenenbacteria-1 TaxID=2013812 RepID=A0A2N1UN10_9BACT|nr:MAG: hypothetical protein CVV26_02725 [Candidatus Kuenenbacteria bacterium HGW-Kuenenbacteria-1]
MKNKNQWKITKISDNKISNSVVNSNDNKKSKKLFKIFIICGVSILISASIIFGVVKAGIITLPIGTPTAQFYTLSEIYDFITNNTPATEGGHNFTFSDNLAGTGHTLTEIYNALANLISVHKVKLGTTYLGVTGALLPSGGDATINDTCLNKTFFGANQTDWNLQTGNLNPTTSTIMSGTTICGIVGTAIANPTYGDNDASKVLTIATNAGAYNASNLTPANVRNTIAFGVDQVGTFSGNLAYGDDNPSEVLTTAAIPGTWNAVNLTNETIKLGVNYGISSTGILVPSSGTANPGDVIFNKTFFGANQTDWNLQTGTFASQEKIATLQGQEVIPNSGNWLSKVIINISNLVASVIKKEQVVGGITGELTPANGASESLTLTTDNAVCGYKYFGSGATSWTTQEGTGCGMACKECSIGSCVNITDNTQDTTNDFNINSSVCNQVCKKCSAGDCINQTNGEDLFAQCNGSSCCGYCDGIGACAFVINGSTCTSPGNACDGSYRCNGSGACEQQAWACGQPIIDSRDSKQYATVQIGSQCWMKQNMNYDQSSFGNDWCYNNDENNCNIYGRLYTWVSAMQNSTGCNGTGAPPNDRCSTLVQGICPIGWHMPSFFEFITLSKNVGSNPDAFSYDYSYGEKGTDEGSNLKENGSTHWTNNVCSPATPTNGVCNASNFSALPGGNIYRGSDFYEINNTSYFWATTGDNVIAKIYYLNGYSTIVGIGYQTWSDSGHSIRCLKD